jgi:glycosyltransferase involved in cell wall biosynthesis
VGLRVVLITSELPPDIGGIASHVDELARGLVQEGQNVKVVYARSLVSTSAKQDARGYVVHRPRVFMGEPLYQVMLRSWLLRSLRRAPADILHVHGMRPLGATRGLSAPTVFTNHTSGFLNRLQASPYRQKRTMRLLEHVSYLIGPSQELVEGARTLGYRGPAAMIANGVDVDRFRPGAAAMRASLGIGPDEVAILLARRLVDKNGVVWFARAAAQLRHLPIRVIVAGDGPEWTSMHAILHESGMLERTVFLGAVANKDMPAVYRAGDLSVLPSLAEATSISGLEAMASGLPLVGTRVGGIPAIIDDGATGFLVPARDSDAMAVAIGKLVADRDLRRRFGAEARSKVEREFAWPIIVRRTMEAYRLCIEAAPRSGNEPA